MRPLVSHLVPLCLVVSSCGAPLVEQGGGAPSPRPIIGHLESRDHRLTLYVMDGGARFAVRTRDGQVIADALTAEELAASHPALFRLYQDSLARPLDARVDLPTDDRRR